MRESDEVVNQSEIILTSLQTIIDGSYSYSEGETLDCQENEDDMKNVYQQFVKQQQERKQLLQTHEQQLERLILNHKILVGLKNQQESIKDKAKQSQAYLNLSIEQMNTLTDELIHHKQQLLKNNQNEHWRDNLMSFYEKLNAINKKQREIAEELRVVWEKVYENKNRINRINQRVENLNEQLMRTNRNILEKRQRISQIERTNIENNHMYIRCSSYLNRNGMTQLSNQSI